MTCRLDALSSEPLLKHLISKPCLLLQWRPFHALCWLKLAVAQTTWGHTIPRASHLQTYLLHSTQEKLEEARMFLGLCAFLDLQDNL